ncbi:MAG: aminotransferase class V-fold PLP-dependent enzyme, partial [Amylibacter sp.]
MITTVENIMDEVRDRFCLVDSCPDQGARIFFENAGGALTLKSVVETSAQYAAIPDNQGRDNPASQQAGCMIAASKDNIRTFLNANGGQIFTGESGTELLFRLISAACLGTPKGGAVLGSTLEHPASRSACVRWAEIAGKSYVSASHNDATGTVSVEDYLPHITAETRVATILHTSPVTGISVDVGAIAKAIRDISPDCIIIVDGIQHAAHGGLDIDAYDIDGYVISPYKVFSRHGYGIAWISDRLAAMPHDTLIGAPNAPWELGTRDAGSYATFSDVVGYFEWLGGRVSNATTARDKVIAAGHAIAAQENALVDTMLHGVGGETGLADMPEITVIGGIDNPHREGLCSIIVKGQPSGDVVAKLSEHGVRVHIRRADHYSGNILTPLGLDSCIRVSMCHYNTKQEVQAFLKTMKTIV